MVDPREWCRRGLGSPDSASIERGAGDRPQNFINAPASAVLVGTICALAIASAVRDEGVDELMPGV